MKNSARGKSFISRWISRNNNAAAPDEDSASEIDSAFSSIGSPPPLTEASSSTDSSSVLHTPPPLPRRTTVPQDTHPRKQLGSGISRSITPAQRQALTPAASRVRTPHTPQVRPVPLPPTPSPVPLPRQPRRLAVSLPLNTPRPVIEVSPCAAVIVRPKPVVPRPNAKIHDLLSYIPNKRKIIFDLILPSGFIRQYPLLPQPAAVVKHQEPKARPYVPLQPISKSTLYERATNPPATRLKVVSNDFYWEIDIRGHATSENPRGYVLVGDVLSCLHMKLRTQVTPAEYNNAPKNFQAQVKKAYSRRCRAWKKHMEKEDEDKNGVRRVDFLLDMTMFVGLERREEAVAPDAEDRHVTTWLLKLEPHSD